MKYDVKAIRKHLRLSQKEMSEKLGIRQSFLSAIETGKSPLPADKAQMLRMMLPDNDIDNFTLQSDTATATPHQTVTILENGETNMFKELLNYFHNQAHREQDEHHINMHRQLDTMQERIDRLTEKNDALVTKNEQLAAKVESLREELHISKTENLRLKELLLSNGIRP